MASSQEDLNRILRFQYRVYVEEMGKKPPYADHQKKILIDELDYKADYFFTEKDGEVSSCLRLNSVSHPGVLQKYEKSLALSTFLKDHSPDQMKLSTRLMVAPELRGTQVLGALLSEGYEYQRKAGHLFNFCFCAPSLVNLYELIGFRKYTDNFMIPGAGLHVPLVLLLEDYEFMKEVRSPFIRIAKNYPKKEAGRIWFENSFPRHSELVNERLIGASDFWDYLESRLHSYEVPFFEGLSQTEIESLIKKATVVHTKENEAIIKTQDFGNEIYLLLEGSAEIRKPTSKGYESVATLGRGDLFGEISFFTKGFRTADAVSLEESKVLCFGRSFFEKLKKSEPEIAAKVLWNLSSLIARRLQTSTDKWIENRTEREGEDE